MKKSISSFIFINGPEVIPAELWLDEIEAY